MLTEYQPEEELISDSKYATADLFVENRPIEGFRTIILSRPVIMPIVDSHARATLVGHLGVSSINPEIFARDYRLPSMGQRPAGAAEPRTGLPVVPGLLVVDQPSVTTEVVLQTALDMEVELTGLLQTLLLVHRHNLMGYSKLVVAGSGRFHYGDVGIGLANFWRDVSRNANGQKVVQHGLGLLPMVQEWWRDTVFPFVAPVSISAPADDPA
jgi:hypothetical protein